MEAPAGTVVATGYWLPNKLCRVRLTNISPLIGYDPKHRVTMIAMPDLYATREQNGLINGCSQVALRSVGRSAAGIGLNAVDIDRCSHVLLKDRTNVR